MFVVRRSFRNNGTMMLPGSTVEPGSIKWFKTRLKDRDIIEVTPHTFKAWDSYFTQKFGVKLPSLTGQSTVEKPKETTTAPIKPMRVVAIVKE